MSDKRFQGDREAINNSLRDASRLIDLFPADVLLTVRTVPASGPGGRSIYFKPADFVDHHQGLIRLNDANRHVFIGANPRDREAGDSEAVSTTYACVVDMDGGTTPEQLNAAVVELIGQAPTVTVHTGGGAQGWLFLREPIPVAEWRKIQRGLIAAVDGADATIKDPARMLRLPGFYNPKSKYAPDFPLAKIVDIDANRKFDPAELPHSTFREAEPIGERVELRVDDGYLSTKARAFLERGELYPAPGGAEPSRRNSAFNVACEAAASNIPREEIEPEIIERLIELGLDAQELEDFPRQLENAYSKPRTPRIEAEDAPKIILPATSGKPVVTFRETPGGKTSVSVRVGDRIHTGEVDFTSDNQRDKFFRAAKKRFPDADLTEVEDQLHAFAAGEIAAEPAPPPPPLTRDDEVPAGSVIRPERAIVRSGSAVCSMLTVPVKRKVDGELSDYWMAHITKGASREAIAIPPGIEVEGTHFHISPNLDGQPVELERTWSRDSRWNWLEHGKDEMPPAELFKSLTETISYFIDFDIETAGNMVPVMAVFAAATYAAPVLTTYPILSFHGPFMSGKSRGLEILNELVLRPVYTPDISPAAVFRLVDGYGCVILLDEAEQIHGAQIGAHADLRSLFLSGYKPSASVMRCIGENFTPTSFRTAGFKGMASIKEPDPTLGSRCISTFMTAVPKGSNFANRQPGEEGYEKVWQPLRDALHVWAMNRGAELLDLCPADDLVPKQLKARAREIWAPLFQIAELFQRQGVPGLVDTIREVAVFKAASTEGVSITDAQLVALQVAARMGREHRKDPKRYPLPSAGKIAEAASQAGEHVAAAKAAEWVRSYGFRSRQLGGRTVFEMPADRVLTVQERYGIDLGAEAVTQNEAGGTSEVATLPTLPTSDCSESPKIDSRGGQGGLGGHLQGRGGADVSQKSADPDSKPEQPPAKPKASRSKTSKAKGKGKQAPEQAARPGRVEL